MAKPVTPATPSKLPDPSVWKLCKHPECQKYKREFDEMSKARVDLEMKKSFMFKAPDHFAVFLEDFCWEHLPDEAKSLYKDKIEAWVKAKYSLEGANLYRVSLKGAELDNADLHEANLARVNFQGVSLYSANLERAWLLEANLQEAKLRDANLQKAYLGNADFWGAELPYANLKGANLYEADFRKGDLYSANFEEADLLSANFRGADMVKANLQGAKLYYAQLEDAYLRDALWEGAKGLLIKRVGEETGKEWKSAASFYGRLRVYFRRQEDYDREAEAYYRQKLMQKHEAFWEFSKGHQPIDQREGLIIYRVIRPGFKFLFYLLFKKVSMTTESREEYLHNLGQRVKEFPRWLGLWIFHVFTGFGERWWLTALWAVGFVLGFGFIYWLGGSVGWFHNLDGSKAFLDFWDSLYFSVLAFSTFGFAEFKPIAGLAKVLLVAEIVMGYVFLGTLVTLIARKMGR